MARKGKPEPSGEPGSEQLVAGIDLREIEKLLGFMQKHNLEDFEYERDAFHIRLKKPSAHAAWPPASYERHGAPLAAAASASLPHAAAEPAAAQHGSLESDLHVIKSPIVGTFYGAPSPGAEPFVTVGSRVEAGQVLCIIEAMKLMNEIESDVAGEVARIFLENGHPVEYGEPLFGIKPGKPRAK